MSTTASPVSDSHRSGVPRIALRAGVLIAVSIAAIAVLTWTASRPAILAGSRLILRGATLGSERPAAVEVVATPGLSRTRVSGFSYVIDRTPGTVPEPVVNAQPLPETRSLAIPTYDKSGQANHPSVIDFLAEYGTPTWAGYRYWMSMTPYPGDDDQHENPSLLASNDGVAWVSPAGVPAPLIGPLPGGVPLWKHYSDPELVYDPEMDRLVVFYRENDGRQADSPEFIHRLDVSWTNGRFSTGQHLSVISRFNRDTEILSPAVVIDGQGTWHMWFVSFYPEGGSSSQSGTAKLLYASSPDGLVWGDPRECIPTLNAYYAAVRPKPYHLFGGGEALFPWHLEAKRLGDEVQLLIATTRLPSAPSPGDGSALYIATASLAEPTALTYPADVPLLNGGSLSAVYRAGFVPGRTFRVWYSIRDADPDPLLPGRWRIATMEGLVTKGKTWLPASSTQISLRGLAPGRWYCHVRAVSSLGAWSDPAHIAIDVGE